MADDRGPFRVVRVTLSADTAQMANNDIIADTQELADVMHQKGGTAILRSVTLLDGDDQGQNIDVVFLKDDKTLGTENSGITASDVNAAYVLGVVAVTDWKDFINGQIATEENIGIVMDAESDSRSLFVAAVCREGTPTYTASGLVLTCGFERNMG